MVLKKTYPYLFAFLFFFAVQIFLTTFSIPSYVFPLPTEIFKVFLIDWQFLIQAFWITSLEWVVGVIIAIVLGVFLSFLSFRFKAFDKILAPFLIISQSVPYLVFTPLLMMWFGLGILPKIILVILTCVFPIALVLRNDLSFYQKEYSVLVQSLKMNFWKACFHVYFPASLQGFFNALRVSVSYSFGSAVVAELMGSEGGLGVYLLRAQNTYRTERVFAVAILIVVITILSSKCVDLMSQKFIFWNRTKK